MAATKGKLTKGQQDQIRDAIKSRQLVNRLQTFALGEVAPNAKEGTGPAEIDSLRLRAIEILLRKAVPDLQAITLETGENGFVVTIASDPTKL